MRPLIDDGRAGLPVIEIAADGRRVSLHAEVTIVGCGTGTDIRLHEAGVSLLHAELVRRGPYVYVADLGLSESGTFVNGRPVVTRRLLADHDIVSFGPARTVITGIPPEDPVSAGPAPAAPWLTRRESDVLAALCRPALARPAAGGAVFLSPASIAEIAAALAVTDAAVKQHLLRLYVKFGVPEGPERRTHLANAAIATGPGFLSTGPAASDRTVITLAT